MTEPKPLEQLRDVASRADRAALMADGHLGYVMPIGGVAAYRDRVSVVGVGFDIACGNAAIRTDLTRAQVAPHLRELADGIQEAISFGVGRKNQADDAPTDHPLFEDPAWEAVPDRHERDRLRAKARSQLGTVGSGNHYVDVFADDADRIWVGVHFGSRGFGFGVAHGFLALGQNRAWGERVPERETLLDVTSPVGDAYWQLMNLAGRYAYAGREWVARKVVELLGGREQELVHNHHNFAWREEHGGEPFYVVRKGATPAFPGQKGFVGGSMGDDAVIIQGVASDSAEVRDLQARALYSTVHGAGRVMSRTAAAGSPGEPVDSIDPPLEFVVRPLERRARVDRQLAREVDDGKEEIADLILQGVTHPAARIPHLDFELPDLLSHLLHRSFRIRPIEPHARRPFLQSICPQERRQGRPQSTEGPAARSPLPPFHPLPPLMIRRLRVAEQLRMPPPHLFLKGACDRFGVELAFLLPDHDLKREVQQQVTQLVA